MLEVVAPEIVDDRLVSSSVIRGLIEQGDVAEAGQLLGHRYRLEGQVVTGAQRGRTLGFPTANLAEVATLVPANGVYAATSTIDGRQWAAAVNIVGHEALGGLMPALGGLGHGGIVDHRSDARRSR